MATEAALESFAKRLSEAKALGKGSIAFRLSGPESGQYFLDCSKGVAKLVKGTPPHHPIIELIGDAARIVAILEGKKDARAQFLVGGFRIRGDLRYASDLALELGIIQDPL